MTLRRHTAEWLGFHDAQEERAPRGMQPGKFRRYSIIGLGPTFIMTAACYDVVWRETGAGKFTIINADGTERIVDGVVQVP